MQAFYAPSTGFSALFNLHNRDLKGSARLFRANIIKKGSNDLVDGFDAAKISTDGQNTQNLQLTAVGGGSNVTKLISAEKATGQGMEFNLDAYLTEHCWSPRAAASPTPRSRTHHWPWPAVPSAASPTPRW